MQKRFALLAFVTTSSLIAPFVAGACGMSIVPSLSASGWDYGNDSAEQAYIHYDKGVEDLIISRNFTNENENTVWVIPVPATPVGVHVEVLAENPKFFGSDVVQSAKQTVSGTELALSATQLYPLIPLFFLSSTVSFGNERGVAVPQATLGGSKSLPRAAVQVFEHIEKNGMTAEVLSAVSSDALYVYLHKKGLNVQKDSVAILQDYIGKDFSFVATWVSPTVDAGVAKGVLIHFPTKKMFYPLKPESGTPGEGLPETITIVGHVTPKLFSGIKDSTHIDYFTSYEGSKLTNFFSSDTAFDYTKVVINTAPRNLTEDLYFSPHAPLHVTFAKVVAAHPIAFFVFGLMLVSLLASLIVSRLLVSERRNVTTVKMAFASCFTLIGTGIGVAIFLKEKRFKFVVLFSFAFLALTWAIGFLVTKALS